MGKGGGGGGGREGGRREERGWGSWGRLDGYMWGGGCGAAAVTPRSRTFLEIFVERVQRAETDRTTETQRPCLSNASESAAGVQLSMETFNQSGKLQNQQTDLSSVTLNELWLCVSVKQQRSHYSRHVSVCFCNACWVIILNITVNFCF